MEEQATPNSPNEKYRTAFRVSEENVRRRCDPATLPAPEEALASFDRDGMIGQNRAVSAIATGLAMERPGYHIVVSGPAGTGKKSYVEARARAYAKDRPIPDDWCYVFNFHDPNAPIALSFRAGQGRSFQTAVTRMIDDLKRSLRQTFESDVYQQELRRLTEQYRQRSEQLWNALQAEAQSLGFAFQRTPTGLISVPLDAYGRPMEPDVLERLSREQREEIAARSRQLQEKLDDAMRQQINLEREAREASAHLEQETGHTVAQRLINQLRQNYEDAPKVLRYLDDLLDDVTTHLSLFREQEQPNVPTPAVFATLESGDPLLRYRVNLFVHHDREEGAPVIFERNPTYANVFGKIEYRSTFGTATTNFTLIQPGMLQRANGGYLILEIESVLNNPGVWPTLKRVLTSREVRTENLSEQYALVPTGTLRPEPIPLNVKVFLIGEPHYFFLLSRADADFQKLFQIRADFDSVMAYSDENRSKLYGFMLSYVEREGLLLLQPDAAAASLEYSCRLAEDQERLSARLSALLSVIDEASMLAHKRKAGAITRTDIEEALEARHYRAGLIEEKVTELFHDGILLLTVDGERVGMINGLAVLSPGETAFGQPNRITARVWVGQTGIVHVERQSEKSGPIHNKGVSILQAHLASRYATDFPLTLSASLTFEQVYDEIDGDSASSAELYALISALADLPIDQSLAVTGSVNQFGEIQPIGGVNEKIEGFFRVCKVKGLTGRQGVIIPRQNVRNLMLHPEVTQAIQDGQFHVYAIDTVDQGLSILTGKPTEEINQRALEGLRRIYERVRRRPERNDQESPSNDSTSNRKGSDLQ
ncbi:MAG: AAA family ATPase [Firmicutes bacterium]|nr:AAA family ATPase [Bacillota bacterium]